MAGPYTGMAFDRVCDPIAELQDMIYAPDVVHVDTGGQDWARITYRDGTHIIVTARAYDERP